MEKKLQVRDLRISFHTSNGKVQAVRGIDFDLEKGETLAIVGESGSGKSVTSKAILGILAGNSIVESGEIIYDGQDLLKISEEDFHKIRGDKISMIFQDPMSSLNPIVRIGKQLTEAMILKGKSRQRESKRNFNRYLGALKDAMAKSGSGSSDTERANANCKKFNKSEFKHAKMESAYRAAHDAAQEASEDISKIAFEIEKNALGKDAKDRIGDIVRQSNESVNPYVVPVERKAEMKGLTDSLKKRFKAKDNNGMIECLHKIKDILDEALANPAPDFFCMGYYLCYSGQPLPDLPIGQLDERLKEYTDKDFMLEFQEDVERALRYSAGVRIENIRAAEKALEDSLATYDAESWDRKQCMDQYKILCAATKKTADPLALEKDSLSNTFAPSLKGELDTYFRAIKENKRIQKKYERDKRKYDAIIAKGKKPGWELADAPVTDLEMIRGNVTHLIRRLLDHYQEILEAEEKLDFKDEAVAAIDYLKKNASGVLAKVTGQVAKHRAIKLMEEVGIAEPHKRYRQYPFEFSGGMRQRIVIAIALAADPDILICDEPTTALDVTIQSQILELINRLKEERKLSVIFITHDLGVVANMADRVAVMYAGKIVEYGTSEDIFYDSRHPYTWALLSSMPDLDTNEKLEAIPGTPPNMIYPPKGDAFAPRNRYAMQIDFERQPPMFRVSDTHYAATWLLHPDAPKVEPPKAIKDRIARMEGRRRQAGNA